MLSLRQALSLNSSRVLGGDFSVYSCVFDGVDESVIVPNAAALKPVTEMTISLWMKPDTWDLSTGGTTQYAIGCIQSGGWGIYLQKAGGSTKLKFQVRITDITPGCGGSNSYIYAELAAAQTENLSGWVNVVATYKNGTATLKYNTSTVGVTNGAGCSSATIHYHPTISRPIFIGADASSATAGSDFFKGNIDEVAIFNELVSDSDINSIYNGGTPNDISSISGLVGWWRMGDPDGPSTFSTIPDASTNSNNGAMDNMVAGDIVTDVP